MTFEELKTTLDDLRIEAIGANRTAAARKAALTSMLRLIAEFRKEDPATAKREAAALARSEALALGRLGKAPQAAACLAPHLPKWKKGPYWADRQFVYSQPSLLALLIIDDLDEKGAKAAQSLGLSGPRLYATLADLALAKKKLAAAAGHLEALRESLETTEPGPTMEARAWVLVARHAAATGDREAALQALKKAGALRVEHPPLRYTLPTLIRAARELRPLGSEALSALEGRVAATKKAEAKATTKKVAATKKAAARPRKTASR